MAEHTGIEWCDATFNPWWGCEKVSPGCAHCYADTLSKRYANGVQLWGDGHEFRFFDDKHWAEPLKWARTLPAKLGRRPRVFCASMADVFEERPELVEPRARLFNLIAETPELDWLILTKRPEYARDVFAAWDRWDDEYNGPDEKLWPLPNVWMGVSIENARYSWRADVLREIPAAVRFISAEPLLGSLYPSEDTWSPQSSSGSQLSTSRSSTPSTTLRGSSPTGLTLDRSAIRRARSETETESSSVPSSTISSSSRSATSGRAPLDLTGIDWIIIGGESGPKSRPSHLEHAREIIDRCIHLCESCARAYYEDGITPTAPVCTGRPALFVKQLGAKPHMDVPAFDGSGPRSCRIHLRDRKGGDWSEFPVDLKIREFPQSAAVPA